VSAIVFASIAVDLHTRKSFQLHWLLAISLGCPPVTMCSPRFPAVTRVIVGDTADLPLPADRRTSTLFSLRRTSGAGR
jgi:hypothetical protein